MNDQQETDLPRDEYLCAALRHAPDADVGAPADLGLKIRAAALRVSTVSAATPSPSPVVPAWPQRLWAWLGQPGRMGASGAFATLLIAAVLGLVWRSEVPPTQVRDEPMAARPQSPAGTTPDSRASASSPSVAAADAQDANALRATAPAAEQGVSAPYRRAGQSPPTGPTMTVAPPAAREPHSAPATAETAAAPAEAEAARGRAEGNADTAAPNAAATPAAPRASTDAIRRLSRDGSLGSSRAIGGASNPDFASWLDEAALKRVDAPELLAELAAFTRGRWLQAAAVPQDRPVVHLPANGRTAAMLTLGNDAVWGCLMTPELRCQRAPLTLEQASRLRELLAQRR
jgi:hypothetical protein